MHWRDELLTTLDAEHRAQDRAQDAEERCVSAATALTAAMERWRVLVRRRSHPVLPWKSVAADVQAVIDRLKKPE